MSAGDETSRVAAEIARLQRLGRRCSALRLIAFAAMLAGLVAAFDSASYLAAVSLPALAAFAAVFVVHGRWLDRKEALEVELTLLREAEARRGTRRRERPPPKVPADGAPLEAGGRIYAPEPESHPLDPWVAEDLDLFDAPRSLFGFLDWTSTVFGARRLRHVLLHPLRRAADIRARQEAVAEAARRADARRGLLACLLPLRRHDLAPLSRLLGAVPAFAGRRGLLLWANVLGTLAPLSLVIVAVTGRLELLSASVVLGLINFFTIARYVGESNAERDRLLLFRPFLDGLLALRRAMAAPGLQSALWREAEGAVASLEPHARKLKRRVALLAFHSYGVVFEIVNIVVLWELRILPLAAALVARHRPELQAAAGALGEAEAILSLSLPLAEQEGFSLPEALEGDRPRLEAEAMAHPLLEPGAAVRNRLALGEECRVLIVTGSNMSGKSTFLKAAGVNLVLAGAGGPVCAARWRWTPLALHTDMNVRDSLDDGLSYFQAEVERVLGVIRAARENPMLLGLFDELFRGTNPEERVAIARAVLRHLRSAGALLIVATHDRSVSQLASADREPGMEAFHFEETVTGGVMRFDYRLREGEARTRNAIRVLEHQGYPPEVVEEARRLAGGAPDEASPGRMGGPAG